MLFSAIAVSSDQGQAIILAPPVIGFVTGVAWRFERSAGIALAVGVLVLVVAGGVLVGPALEYLASMAFVAVVGSLYAVGGYLIAREGQSVARRVIAGVVLVALTLPVAAITLLAGLVLSCDLGGQCPE